VIIQLSSTLQLITGAVGDRLWNFCPYVSTGSSLQRWLRCQKWNI